MHHLHSFYLEHYVLRTSQQSSHLQQYIRTYLLHHRKVSTCAKCHKQYEGKTGRKLKVRATEYIRSIRNNTADNLVIGLRFGNSYQTCKHMQVNGFEALQSSIG